MAGPGAPVRGVSVRVISRGAGAVIRGAAVSVAGRAAILAAGEIAAPSRDSAVRGPGAGRLIPVCAPAEVVAAAEGLTLKILDVTGAPARSGAATDRRAACTCSPRVKASDDTAVIASWLASWLAEKNRLAVRGPCRCPRFTF